MASEESLLGASRKELFSVLKRRDMRRNPRPSLPALDCHWMRTIFLQSLYPFWGHEGDMVDTLMLEEDKKIKSVLLWSVAPPSLGSRVDPC